MVNDQEQDDVVPLVCCGFDTMVDAPSSVQQGEAQDVILVMNAADPSGTPPSCSDFLVQFSFWSSTDASVVIKININGQPCPPGMDMTVTDKGCRFVQGKSLKPPADALQAMRVHLLPGKNLIRYSAIFVNDENHLHVVMARAEAHLFLWNSNVRVIVCDIDGTITRSNARGVLDTMVLESYAYIHDGVTLFLSNLLRSNENGLRIMYLTSRPLSFAQTTRRFLSGLCQSKQRLPEGPLLLHPGTLSSVLLSELVTGNVHQYKSDALLRQVVLTFAAAGRTSEDDLLVAGFGNSRTDSVAYEMAGIQRHNIYVIDKSSRIRCTDSRRPQQDTLDTNTTCTTAMVVDKVQPQQRAHWQGSAIIWIDDDDDDLPKATSLLDSSDGAATSRQTQIVGGATSSVVLPSSSTGPSYYNGYHDPELLKHVLEKMNVVRL